MKLLSCLRRSLLNLGIHTAEPYNKILTTDDFCVSFSSGFMELSCGKLEDFGIYRCDGLCRVQFGRPFG